MLYVSVILFFFINNCISFSEFDDVAQDPVIDLLLNSNNLVEYSGSDTKNTDEIIYSDGLWKCRNCSNEDNLIYSETYEFYLNDYEDYQDIQVGISVENMRCLTIKAKKSAKISIVDGSCKGEITLRIDNTNICEIYVYG